MRKTTRFAILIVFVSCLTAFGFAGEPVGALDGMTFEVTMTAGEDSQPDTLIFTGGRFESMGCREYGFGDAPYHAEASGKSVTFSADTNSKEEGLAHWKGSVDGAAISGTMEWVKAGQDTIVYEFSGSLKS